MINNDKMPDRYGNIVVIGTTGTGKTTLAARIAARTGRGHIDLDDCFWSPGWQMATDSEFAERIRSALSAAPARGWVVSGNYSRMRPIVWSDAQTIVALDYHWLSSFWRLFRRTMRRCWTGQLVCNGNRETFAKAFCSRDSILLWFIQTFRRKRRELDHLINNCPPEYAHLRVYRFRQPKDTATWLQTL